MTWPIYRGTGVPHDGIGDLPDPPNWRSFHGGPVVAEHSWSEDDSDAGASRRLGTSESGVGGPEEIQMVNAALYLRRPLLVTGQPGTGKSTLAYSVAKELRLGPVLRWPITSRTTLLDGLYKYDPIGRLREENLRRLRQPDAHSNAGQEFVEDVGRHLRLGPLGTALLPRETPRVLLIDEIDKSDFDLPNDLLNVFEDGEFEIEELSRLPRALSEIDIMTADSDVMARITRGRVQCRAFPFVVLTSNGEREFPPAFLRRCLRLEMRAPDAAQLMQILESHFGPHVADEARNQVREFLDRRRRGHLTTDQLLNAVYLTTSGSRYASGLPSSFADVVDAVLQPLGGAEEI